MGTETQGALPQEQDKTSPCQGAGCRRDATHEVSINQRSVQLCDPCKRTTSAQSLVLLLTH